MTCSQCPLSSWRLALNSPEQTPPCCCPYRKHPPPPPTTTTSPTPRSLRQVYGYCLIKDGREAKVAYPTEGFDDDIAGRSFHHGRCAAQPGLAGNRSWWLA